MQRFLKFFFAAWIFGFFYVFFFNFEERGLLKRPLRIINNDKVLINLKQNIVGSKLKFLKLNEEENAMKISNSPLKFFRKKINMELLPDDRSQVIEVLICSDNNTLGGMTTAVNSILKNTNQTIFFHLLTLPSEVEHLAAWLLHYWPKIVMEIISFEGDISHRLKIGENTRKELASPLNFARYWIPEICPETLGRLIYLDDDVLVLKDIKELWNHPINEHHVLAASIDSVNDMKNFLNFDNPVVKSLGIGKDELAFNAGVFVCNVSEWRKQKITESLTYWMEMNTVTPIYGDGIAGGASQPPMLISLRGKVTTLDQSWHVRHFGWWKGNTYSKNILVDAKLMHWNGRKKPWKKTDNGKFTRIWFEYFIKDPWGQFSVKHPNMFFARLGK